MEPARARSAISMVDLTDLSDDCDSAAVAALCDRASRFGVAAVCVWPEFVAISVEILREFRTDGGPAVATVVNFPTGDERPFSVALQTERALADGADEIDVVLPFRAFAAGDREWPPAVLQQVRTITDQRALMKVIIESGELPDIGTITRATQFAIEHGADFVKTSTGKSAVSATPEAVSAMLSVIAGERRSIGIKASGGISTAADADVYLELAEQAMGPDWLSPKTFRFGASSLLTALIEAAGGEDAVVEPNGP